MSIRGVHHINCGTMCPIAGRLLGERTGGLTARGHWVAHCLIIETARDGLVVVDTGYGMRQVDRTVRLATPFEVLAKPALDPAETVHAQVKARGFAPSDVRHIVVTHLDLDHAGGIADFPDAKVHLHSREHAAAIAPTSFKDRQRYIRTLWSHGPKWEVYSEDGDTWRGLPAITRLRGIDADIGLLPMHGHTRGHSAVLVSSGGGWLVHAGDAYFHHGTLTGEPVPIGISIFERGVETNPTARRASAAALRELHERYDDVEVFCSHDRTELTAAETRRAATAA